MKHVYSGFYTTYKFLQTWQIEIAFFQNAQKIVWIQKINYFFALFSNFISEFEEIRLSGRGKTFISAKLYHFFYITKHFFLNFVSWYKI